jgi:hypothetical protein
MSSLKHRSRKIVKNPLQATLRLCAGVVVLLLSIPAFSQVEQGRIFGSITDQSGGVIAGATVTVLDVARGVSRPLTTDSAGEYNAPNLLPGAYTIKVGATGFRTVERPNIQVQVGGELRVDFTLQPGEQTQTITVTEAVPTIDTTNSTLGGTLTNNTVLELPINGRNPQNLESLLPGVTTKAGGGPTGRSTNGLPTKATVYMLDGQLNKAFYGSTAIIGGSGDIGEGTSLVNLDAIQDFTLEENPKAEVGWAEGVVMNIGIKSGTNNMHGSAFAFGRTGSLDANNAFTPGVPENLQYEQFGGVVGGPIIKNKLFYLLSYEGERLTAGQSAVNQIPTTASIGDPGSSFPDAIAAMNAAGHPVNTMSELMAGCDPTKLTKTMTTGAAVAPFCNAANGLFGNASGAVAVPMTEPNTFTTDNSIIRFDYHINDHHTFMTDFFAGPNNLIESTGVNVQRYWDRTNPRLPEIVQASETWSPTSAVVNQARFGWNRYYTNVRIGECQSNLGQPNYPVAFGLNSGSQVANCGPNQYGALPAIEIGNGTFTGIGCNGTSVGADCDPEPRTERTYQFSDAVSYTRGKHMFKFGGEFRHTISEGWQKISAAGLINFGSGGIDAFPGATALQDFLAGDVSSATVLVGDPLRATHANLFALFAQDDWRITPRLTLNLGLRYEYAQGPTEVNHRLASFDSTTAAGIVQPGVTPGVPSYLYKPDRDNFQPRIGFAWDVKGNGKWVVRGGFGVFTAFVAWSGYFANTGGGIETIPTGGLLFNADGTLRPAPGNINTQVINLNGASGGSGAPGSVIPWVCNPTASSLACAGNPVVPIFNANSPNAQVTCGDGLVANPANGSTPQPCPGNFIQPNIRQGLAYQWNLNVDHAITSSLSIDLAYVGTRGSDLWGILDANQPALGVNNGAKPFAEQQRRLYTQNCLSLGSAGATSTNSAPGGLGLNPSQCFPYLAQIYEITPDGLSEYNGFQASVIQKFSHGLSFTAGYTYSHTLANGLDDISALPMNSRNPRQDYGRAEFDVPNRFTLAANWNLPGRNSPGQMLQGWGINSVLAVQGGLPFNAVDKTNDLSGTAINLDRWTLVGNATSFDLGTDANAPCFGVAGSKRFGKAPCTVVPAGPGPKGSPAYVQNLPAMCQSAAAGEQPGQPGLNSGLMELATLGCYATSNAAIVPPAQGTYGTMGIYGLRGKGLTQWDSSITKSWKFGEKLTSQFRFEVYNVLNSTFYALPSNNLASPSTFGQAQTTQNSGNAINGTGGPRSIELGLKLIF